MPEPSIEGYITTMYVCTSITTMDVMYSLLNNIEVSLIN